MASVVDGNWALPPQVQQPIPAHVSKRSSVVHPSSSEIEAWKKIAMQCPHTRYEAIRRWLHLQPALRGAPINQVIEQTGVLHRKMPHDFINAMFANNTPAREVLVDLLSRFTDHETLDILPEDQVLVVKSAGATTVIRPAADGVFAVILVGTANDRGQPRKSVIHHLQAGEPLPADLLVALDFDWLQI
jgi:hypothetical protein